jgi:hypothetical protein
MVSNDSQCSSSFLLRNCLSLSWFGDWIIAALGSGRALEPIFREHHILTSQLLMDTDEASISVPSVHHDRVY